MREIKFRAFDSKTKKILYNVWPFASLAHVTKGISFDFGTMRAEAKILDIHIYNMMQYTGLKDKNGTEIYEGDILYREFMVLGDIEFNIDGKVIKKPLYREEEYFEVKIPEFYYKLSQLKAGYCDESEENCCSHFEIKGNIYENSALLKEIK